MTRFLVLALTGLLAFTGVAGARDVLVIAHRGACGYAPEHTLEAYAMGHELGADYVETDLVMTADGVLIALHDVVLEPTTNVEEVFPERRRADGSWYAIDFTLEEIRRLEAHERMRPDGTYYYPDRAHLSFTRYRVPTFAELLELVRERNVVSGRDVGVYVELKQPAWHAEQGKPMEVAVLRELAQYGFAGRRANVYLQSFEAQALERLRFELGTELPLVMLISSPEQATREALDRWARFADAIGPYKGLIEANPELVRLAHVRGLDVHAWTFRADDVPRAYRTIEEELRTFVAHYLVDGVFTDFVDDAVAVLEAMGLRP